MSLYFDHVVLKVDDLEQAIEDFQSQGFTVTKGGVHGGGLSENALIFFKDDSFIELFSLTKGIKYTVVQKLKRTKIFKRFQYSAKWGLAYRFYSRGLELPDGISDVCFLSDGFEQECQRINNEGLFLTKVLKASRKKTNGSRIKWQMICPFINEMPFFRSPYQPAAEIDEKLKTHKNGADGISRVVVLALDYKDTLSKYCMFFGQEPLSSSNGEVLRTSFRLKQTMIDILKASENKLLQQQFRGKGIGMYGLQLEGIDLKLDQMDQSKLHGLILLDQ